MSVGRHTLYNLAGFIVPMFVSLATVPAYLHVIGATRYGVIALVLTILGYFGVFDPGIGRAASYHIARLHDGSAKDREDVFWTAMTINLAFGVVGGLFVFVLARPLFASAFNMPDATRDEVIASLPWLAASLPVSIVGNVLSGVLQAREWFGVSNVLSALSAIAVQVVPLAVAYGHGPDLDWLIPAILITRVAGMVPNFVAVTRALPLNSGGGFQPALLKPLFSYGGWITLTNLLNPILTSIDRLLIGSVLNADAVSFYTISYGLVGKMSVVSGALSASLFPKLSRGNQEESGRLASTALVDLAAVTTPLTVICVVVLPIFLRLWLGADNAEHTTQTAIVLLLGVWMNGLTFIPYNLLQARNRPGIIAGFHAAEVMPFLFILWFGLHFYGLVGAAWANTFRIAIDGVFLFAVGGQRLDWQRTLPGVALVLLSPLFALTDVSAATIAFALIPVAGACVWAWLVAPRLRVFVLDRALSILTLRVT